MFAWLFRWGGAVRTWLRENFSPTLQYLYFMRFSLLLWLFPLVFALLDSGAIAVSATSLSRGIWVPEYWEGFTCVGFFLVATGCVALITARTVVLNGVERFAPKWPPCVDQAVQLVPGCAEENKKTGAPPQWLKKVLVSDRTREEFWVVVLALSPALLATGYAIFVAWFEKVPLRHSAAGFLLGYAMAAAFWYVVNAWYYLAYERPMTGMNALLEIGKNAARTILLPRRWFWLKMPGQGIMADGPPHTLEDIRTSLRQGWLGRLAAHAVDWIAEHWGLPGYLYPEGGRVYEAQLFAAIAAGGFLTLFLVLYPLTAPGYTVWAYVAILVVATGFVWVARTIGSGHFPIPTEQNQRLLLRWKIVLTGCAAFFCIMLICMWRLSSPDRFPTLASVLLLMAVLVWGLSASAFALDRYRIPVLTLVIVAAVLPRMFHFYEIGHGAFEEHYLSTTVRAKDATSLQTPAQIVADKLLTIHDDAPLIVVTATGGGLHASAWTTQVLQQLYFELAEAMGTPNHPHYTQAAELMQTHLLLMSTVSGGSVGLRYYLEALHNGSSRERFDQMVVGAQCSSLEAVGWGLTYFDFTRAAGPGLPFVWWPSSGDGDLLQGPMRKDRTWALRRAIERNSADRYCWKTAKTANEGLELEQSEMKLNYGPGQAPPPPLTLDGLPPGSNFPAFTMNTTTAEMGDRFLLANYRLPHYQVGLIEGAPAESFLDIFNGDEKPDLPLATAAQMSATFPMVSSSARFPMKYTKAADSAHFVDGGYYDNDGTSSAIEFLRYSLDKPADPSSVSGQAATDEEQVEVVQQRLAPGGKLKILLIEIRNSADTDAPDQQAIPFALHPTGNMTPAKPSGVLGQLAFPLEGLWSAGHDSVTGRNRNGLDLLVQGHTQNLQLHQIIFDDQTQPGHCGWLLSAQDPLSWSLTPRQRTEVTENANRNGWLNGCYTNAVSFLRGGGVWVEEAPVRCHPPRLPEPTCRNRTGAEWHGH